MQNTWLRCRTWQRRDANMRGATFLVARKRPWLWLTLHRKAWSFFWSIFTTERRIMWLGSLAMSFNSSCWSSSHCNTGQLELIHLLLLIHSSLLWNENERTLINASFMNLTVECIYSMIHSVRKPNHITHCLYFDKFYHNSFSSFIVTHTIENQQWVTRKL